MNPIQAALDDVREEWREGELTDAEAAAGFWALARAALAQQREEST